MGLRPHRGVAERGLNRVGLLSDDPVNDRPIAFRNKCQQFVDFARRWIGTIALISALVVLGAIMHWSA